MKAKKLTSVGALHPILFFAVMYVVVLFLSIFICSSLFYSLNSDGTEEMVVKTTEPVKQQSSFPVQVSTAAVVR
jgi:cytoskeletal protein RodZ